MKTIPVNMSSKKNGKGKFKVMICFWGQGPELAYEANKVY